MGSSQTRDRTCVSCIGRRTLNLDHQGSPRFYFYSNNSRVDFPGSPAIKTLHFQSGGWGGGGGGIPIQSLVREPRSHMPCGQKIKIIKKKVQCCHSGKREGSVRISILHGCTQRPPDPDQSQLLCKLDPISSCQRKLHLPFFVITIPHTLIYLLLVIHSQSFHHSTSIYWVLLKFQAPV